MRVLRRLALLAVVPLVVLRILGWISYEVAPEEKAILFRDHQRQIRSLLDRADDVTAVALGNSHNYGLDFATLRMQGFHLWRPGGDLEEAHYLAETVLPRLRNLQTVLVPMSFGVFDVRNGRSNDRHVTRRQMYAAVPSTNVLPGDRVSWVVGKLHRHLGLDLVARSDHWEGVFRELLPGLTPSEEAREVPRDRFGQSVDPQYVGCRSLPAGDLGARGAARVRRVLELNSAASPNDRRRSVEALDSLLAVLAARHVDVVLYVPPYSEALNHAFPAARREWTERTARSLALRHGATYLDFSEDPRFENRADLFRNADHLNRCGAVAFSRVLREALERS